MQLLLLVVNCVLLHRIAAIPTFYWSKTYKIGDALPANVYEVYENLYIAKMKFGNVEIPATYDYFSYQAEAEYHGKKIVQEKFNILCDPFADDFYWKNVNVDGLTPQLLKEAIVGGTDGKHPFYIGKKYHEFRWKIGRIALPDTGPLKGLILLTDNGELYMATNFDILMYNYDEW